MSAGLRRSRCFDGLGESAFTQCVELFGAGVYERRHDLFLQGDRAEMVYVVARGYVILSRAMPDGRELVTGVLAAGDLVGEERLLGVGERSARATTLGDALVCYAHADAVANAMRRHPQIAVNLAAYVHLQRERAISMVESLAHARVSERLIELILRLAREHGVPEPPGVRIDAPLTHACIAGLIGSTRETVSHEMSRLLRSGCVSVRKRRYYVTSGLAGAATQAAVALAG